MPERLRLILKILCLGLAGLIIYQWSQLATRPDPLASLTLSSMPPTPASSPAGSSGTNTASTKRAPSLSTNLPPAIQAQIDQVVQSEILGSIVRPLPMALLGIAGPDAFLRAPNGQTGLLREGQELAGIKLLHIGTNRVLIEHEGQKKELSVFAGFSSESLLPPPSKKSP